MRISYWLVLVSMVGCTDPGTVNIDPKPQPTGTNNPLSTTSSTTSTFTTSTTTSTKPTTPEYDCNVIPSIPVGYHIVGEFSDSEDFDFNGAGNAVAMYSGNLTERSYDGLTSNVLAAGVVSGFGQAAGTRTLSTGDYVVADVGNGALDFIDGTTGGSVPLSTNFSYPNGVEVDSDDNVYVADQTLGKVVRINAYDTSDFEVITSSITGPNGVILSPDGQTLYVGTFADFPSNKVWAIDRDPAGGWMPARVIYESGGGDNGYDGINVDICGNVYFTEWIVGRVFRLLADGSSGKELVAELPSSWIPNLRWGHDIGGWERDVLYVSDRDQGRIFGLEMGIPGKRHVVLP